MPSEPNLARISALQKLIPDTSSRDWYSIRQEMIDAIPILNPEWTARNLSDPGITIIELLAFVLDSFHYSNDQLHRDSRFLDSFSRQSLISFSELVGYTPSSASPASGDITYSVDIGQDTEITIPEGAELQTSTNPTIYFENDSELTIEGPDFVDTTTDAGTTTSITVADSSIYTVGNKIEIGEDLIIREITSIPDSTTVIFANDPLTTTSISGLKVRSYSSSKTSVPTSVTGSATEGRTQTQNNVGTGDGTPLQEFEISLTPVIDDSLEVFVNEGAGNVLWTQADNNRLVNHEANEEVYEISYSPNERIIVRFGDGTTGKKLPNGATLTVRARLGGGSRGNVKANIITQINTSISVAGTLSVTNSSAASGGSDKESLTSIKTNAPNNLSNIVGNIVTPQDFKTATEQVSGVEKAQAILNGFNIVNIYVVPSGDSGSVPSQSLLNTIESTLNTDSKRLITVRSNALPPNYVTIDMEGKIYLDDDVLRTEVRTNIISAISSYFSTSSRSFGETNNIRTYLHLSDIYYIIENVSGVSHSEITKFTRRPKLEQLRWSGDLSLSNISVSPETVHEIYEIVFISSTKFRVDGILNRTSDVGFVGIPFSTSDSRLSFTATAGSVNMASGDSGRIITNKFLSSSVEMFDREFPIQGKSIGVTGLTDTIVLYGGRL